MKPGVYWYRGPIQTMWDSAAPWGTTESWIVVVIFESMSGCLCARTVGTEASIWEEDLQRMEREGRFVGIARPE